jgi:hypothetical protein
MLSPGGGIFRPTPENWCLFYFFGLIYRRDRRHGGNRSATIVCVDHLLERYSNPDATHLRLYDALSTH